MTTTDKLFAGSIPEMYERLLVPLIFEPYASDLASRLAQARPQSILEVAAGTGVATRAIASQLPAARIVATDLNQPMLDEARKRLPDPRIAWQQADAQALPFEDRRFDAVVCQFGAMFFPDKVQAFKEARRMLKPGGRYVFSVWDRIEENEFADVVTQALAGIFPHDPPRFLARTPHGHHDVEPLRGALQDAGFTDIAVDVLAARSKAPSPREPAVAYCQGTPLRSEIETRDPAGLERATEIASEAIAQRFGRGPVDGKISAFVLTAMG